MTRVLYRSTHDQPRLDDDALGEGCQTDAGASRRLTRAAAAVTGTQGSPARHTAVRSPRTRAQQGKYRSVVSECDVIVVDSGVVPSNDVVDVPVCCMKPLLAKLFLPVT